MKLLKIVYKFFYKKLKKKVGYILYDGTNYYIPLKKGDIGDCLSANMPYNFPFKDELIDYENELIKDLDLKVKYLCTRCKTVYETNEFIVNGFGCNKCLGGN